jgi:hypothetical protein
MNIKQYLNIDSLDKRPDGTEMTHKEKYSTIVHAIGLNNLIPLIPGTKDKIKKALEKDPYLNNIPMKYWDDACGSLQLLNYAYSTGGRKTFYPVPVGVVQLLNRIGINSMSLSDCVCILKEAARIWVEEEQ